MGKRILFKPILALGDVLLLSGAFLIAYYLRFALEVFPERPIPPFEIYVKYSFLVALVGFFMLYSSGAYHLRRLSFGVEDFFAIFRAVTFSFLIIMAMNYALRGTITRYDEETFSRLIVGISWALSLVLLTFWRLGVSALLKMIRKQGRGLKRVLIVGTDQVARGFYKAVKENVDFGYQPVGFLSNGLAVSEQDIDGLRVLGGVADLAEILRKEPVQEVVLACMNLEDAEMPRLISTCERMDVQFSIIPGFFEILTRQMSVQEIADVPIFQLEERMFQRWNRWIKRGMDIGLSLVVLIAMAPAWMLVAVGIKLESRGPVLFRQARVGKGEKIFLVYKFRSMYADAEERRLALLAQNTSSDALIRIANDPRVTPFGRFLRRFSIDEFPQLINVLKGEMSWVGPRPHMPEEVAGYQAWHRRKYDVLPGITGLTQVSGRKNLSLDEMVRLDIYYIENWSPALDLQILLKTIPAVFRGRGAY